MLATTCQRSVETLSFIMTRKISKKKVQRIKKLFGEGFSIYKIALKTKVSYYTVYGLTKLIERGFKSTSEYREHLANQKGFESLTDYYEHLAKKRKRRNNNKELSNLIKTRLEELDKTQLWLAEKIGVTPPCISYYVQGTIVPTENILRKLFSTLKITYKTLDYFSENGFNM